VGTRSMYAMINTIMYGDWKGRRKCKVNLFWARKKHGKCTFVEREEKGKAKEKNTTLRGEGGGRKYIIKYEAKEKKTEEGCGTLGGGGPNMSREATYRKRIRRKTNAILTIRVVEVNGTPHLR